MFLELTLDDLGWALSIALMGESWPVRVKAASCLLTESIQVKVTPISMEDIDLEELERKRRENKGKNISLETSSGEGVVDCFLAIDSFFQKNRNKKLIELPLGLPAKIRIEVEGVPWGYVNKKNRPNFDGSLAPP